MVVKPLAADEADTTDEDVIGNVIDPLCTAVVPLPATVTTIGLTTAVFRYCVPMIGMPWLLTEIGVVTTY